MKRHLFILSLMLLVVGSVQAQSIAKGRCGDKVSWSFDGHTLTLVNSSNPLEVANIPDYNVENNIAPWIEQKLSIRKVYVGRNIRRIGTFAFANCKELEDVEVENSFHLREIGMGAFLNCTQLFSFPFSQALTKIEKISFANCPSLRSLTIKGTTKLEDYAFFTCPNINILELSNTVTLGKSVFASEDKTKNGKAYLLYNGTIKKLPSTITTSNCQAYGIAKQAVQAYLSEKKRFEENEDGEKKVLSSVDKNIPEADAVRDDYYALIVGNQNYRFAPDVPFAKNDAMVFREYCEKTLGIPSHNIHLLENATKHMILEQEIGDWLGREIEERSRKRLIVYYAGHGIPDITESNKSYLLPVDVYSTRPRYGIALDDFYDRIGSLGFAQVTMFIDACFSGVDRNHASVNDGERGTEVEAENAQPTKGNMVVFCAAQGNETAQGYYEQGHGLFTYYLLKELQQSMGNISYSRMGERISRGVKEKAPQLDLKKTQTPMVKTTDEKLLQRQL